MTPRRPAAPHRPAAALCLLSPSLSLLSAALSVLSAFSLRATLSSLAAFSATLSLLAACWTSAAAPPPRAPGPHAPDPHAPCPTRLIVVVHDRATQAPLAGATIVISTDDGRVAVELTDERGRFETAAVRPPATLTIYYGELTVEHALVTCQPPLRLGVDLGH